MPYVKRQLVWLYLFQAFVRLVPQRMTFLHSTVSRLAKFYKLYTDFLLANKWVIFSCPARIFGNLTLLKTDYKQAVKVVAVRRTTARLFVLVPSKYAPGSSEDILSALNSIQVSQVQQIIYGHLTSKQMGYFHLSRVNFDKRSLTLHHSFLPKFDVKLFPLHRVNNACVVSRHNEGIAKRYKR